MFLFITFTKYIYFILEHLSFYQWILLSLIKFKKNSSFEFPFSLYYLLNLYFTFPAFCLLKVFL